MRARSLRDCVLVGGAQASVIVSEVTIAHPALAIKVAEALQERRSMNWLCCLSLIRSGLPNVQACGESGVPQD